MGEPMSYGFTAIPHRTLSLGDEIGKGRFKHVRKAVLQRRPVAVLQYPLDSIAGPGSMDLSICAQNELDIFRRLSEHGQNPHLPEIYGSCQKKDSLWLAQEISSFGALRSVVLDRETSQPFTVTHKVHASRQLADAMIFLKNNRIVHADLSCRNVLLFRLESDPAMTIIKLVDFGLALTLPELSERVSHKQPKAVRWCAPETVKDSCFSYNSDAWSFGATLWELFSDGLAPWGNLKKRSDVTERLCALLDKSANFDAMTEFPRPNGCPVVMHQAILSVLRLTEHDRASIEALQKFLAGVVRGEKVCMSGEVQQDKSAATSLECAGKVSVDGEAAEQILDSNQALENTIDDLTVQIIDDVTADVTVQSDDVTAQSDDLTVQTIDDLTVQTVDDVTAQRDDLAGDEEDAKNSEDDEDDDFMPVFERRRSLLNPHTGEEEYFHPDEEFSEAAVEGVQHMAEIESSDAEASTRSEVEECSGGELQPQHSLLSTAATSQADSGASSPRTPRHVDCSTTRFECPGPMQGIRTSTPVARSSILFRSVAGGLVERVSVPGVRASTPGQAFGDSPNLSNFAAQSCRIPLVHTFTKPSLLTHSSTPAVVFQSLRSRSVLQERGAMSGSCTSFGCQAPEDSRLCAIQANSGVQHIMPQALSCRSSFSVRSSSPLRLSCPSPFA